AAIAEVARLDYTVLIIDQISHAWAGSGGILEQHAAATAASRSKNGFVQWQKHGAMLNALIEAILAYPHHTICTMRAKVKYRQDKDGTISKIGTRPIQRNEIEFEFTGMGRMTSDHSLEFEGSRCQAINHRKFFQPDASLGAIFGEWIVAGRVEQELPLSTLDAR